MKSLSRRWVKSATTNQSRLTQLPLKRAMAEKQEGKEIRTTETYGVFTVDSKLDGKLFDIPPK